MAGFKLKMASGGSSVQGVGYLNAAASSPSRAWVDAFEFGMTAVASAAFVWVMQRCTTAATGTSRTPQTDDPADAATSYTAQDTVTADGTLTANAFMMWWPMYQNNSARWVALNDRQRVTIPATASNGLMFGLSAASTVVSGATVEFEA